VAEYRLYLGEAAQQAGPDDLAVLSPAMHPSPGQYRPAVLPFQGEPGGSTPRAGAAAVGRLGTPVASGGVVARHAARVVAAARSARGAAVAAAAAASPRPAPLELPSISDGGGEQELAAELSGALAAASGRWVDPLLSPCPVAVGWVQRHQC
jgi:hypothetical protein